MACGQHQSRGLGRQAPQELSPAGLHNEAAPLPTGQRHGRHGYCPKPRAQGAQRNRCRIGEKQASKSGKEAGSRAASWSQESACRVKGSQTTGCQGEQSYVKIRGQAKLLFYNQQSVAKGAWRVMPGQGKVGCKRTRRPRWTVTKGWSVASTQAGGRDVQAAARLARFCRKRVAAALAMLARVLGADS